MIRYQFWGFTLFVFALYAKNLVEGGEADTLALGLVGGLGFFGGAIGMVLAQKWKDTIPPVRLLLGSMALLGAARRVRLVHLARRFRRAAVHGVLLVLRRQDLGGHRDAAGDARRLPRASVRAVRHRVQRSGFIVPALLSIMWIEDDPDRVRQILLASGVVFLILTASSRGGRARSAISSRRRTTSWRWRSDAGLPESRPGRRGGRVPGAPPRPARPRRSGA